MPAGAVGVRYRINARDEIVFVDEAWEAIASALPAPHVRPASVTGRVLWEFIGDGVTRALYEQLLARVRAGRTAQFNLRCDSATYRRLVRMTVAPETEGCVDFRTETLEVHRREPQPLLSLDIPRSDDFVRACGWCNRIDVGTDDWIEVEDAVERLRLFEQDAVPHLSHGVCESCHATLLQTIDDLGQGS